tara:strand:+ start:356 stop:1579 length:1224 start_codon:yes stop_codon:yes gene_type:complete
MPILVGDTSGIAQGISTAGGALAQALQRRAESRLVGQKRNALSDTLQNADLSSEEGQKDFLRSYTSSGGDIKEGLAAIKQFQPSQLDMFLKKFQTPTSDAPVTPGGSGNPNIIEAGVTPANTRTATKQTPFSDIPEEALVMAAGSENKGLAEFGKAVLDNRDRKNKRYVEERKYQTDKAKKHMERIEDSRQSSRLTRSAIDAMKWGVQNADLSQFSQDWWAKQMGAWGQGLVTPEGAIVGQGMKEFLVGDLERIKGRPNMFLEQRLLSLAASIGNTEEANLATLASLETRQYIREKEIEITDRISEQYANDPDFGFEPGNISRIVSSQLEPYAEEAEEKLSYELRALQEKSQGVEKLANKKAVPGTPLTLEMMSHFARKYGKEEGRKKAEQFGYKILTADEYKRHQL